MRGLTYTLFLVCFSILLISLPSDAEEYGNTEFYLAKSGIGDVYDLSIDEPLKLHPSIGSVVMTLTKLTLSFL